MRQKKFYLLILLILIILPACFLAYEKADTPLLIGLSYPFYMDNEIEFNLGFELALEQINSSGGINGRPLKILKVDDTGSVSVGMKAAQYFIEHNVQAVIGHFNSRVARITAHIYDTNDIVYIAPCATTPFLMEDFYTKVFRTIPDDKRVMEYMFQFLEEEGINQVAIYYAEDDFGRAVAHSAQLAAYDHGIEIVDRTSILHRNNFNQVMARWRALDCQAVLIADLFDNVKDQIKDIKQALPKIMILGTSSLDYPDYIHYLGVNAEDSIIPTHYNPHSTSQSNQKFRYAFKNKYNNEPDMYAAIAYDTLMLLKEGLLKATEKETFKTDPSGTLSKALLSINEFQGVTGKTKFDKKGEIEGDNIFLKMVVDGKFVFLNEKH